MTNKAPILLIPGVIAPNNLKYWKYFNSPILDEHKHYHICKIDHWGTLEKRSQQIDSYIAQNLGYSNFHIISHSKGGLDLYYLLKIRPELAKQIITHTAISSPFKGSTIAKLFVYILYPFHFIPRIKEIGMTLREIANYTTQYNHYKFKQFYIASNISNLLFTYPLFIFTYVLLKLTEGPNDGFVSINSATHGDCLKIENTDHVGLIGHFFTNHRKNKFSNLLNLIEQNIYE